MDLELTKDSLILAQQELIKQFKAQIEDLQKLVKCDSPFCNREVNTCFGCKMRLCKFCPGGKWIVECDCGREYCEKCRKKEIIPLYFAISCKACNRRQ